MKALIFASILFSQVAVASNPSIPACIEGLRTKIRSGSYSGTFGSGPDAGRRCYVNVLIIGGETRLNSIRVELRGTFVQRIFEVSSRPNDGLQTCKQTGNEFLLQRRYDSPGRSNEFSVNANSVKVTDFDSESGHSYATTCHLR